MIDLNQHKLELNYPCTWEYKLIAYSQEEVLKGIQDVLLQREYKLTPSNISKKGKFLSFALEIIVQNEDDRVTIYELFNKHQSIKMVL